jgi:REP element-mobilizing transposase RayT
MILSDVEYHLVLLPVIGPDYSDKIKSDLSIIIPDALLQFKGGVKKLTVSRDQVYVHFSSSPDASPKEIAQTLIHEVSLRLKRVNSELAGYNSVFRDTYFIKTGSRPTKTQVKDFIGLSITGV